MNRWAFVLHVAARYLRSASSGRRASSVLSTLGVGAGVMTLVAVIGVMNGFQLGFIEDILEVSSYHIQVDGAPLETELARSISAIDGVTSITRFRDGQALAGSAGADLRGVLVRGLDSRAAREDRGFVDHLQIVSGARDPAGGVVLGVELAYALGVDSGDTIELLTLGGAGGLATRYETLAVTGVFRTGYLDFDSGLLFVSLDTAALLFGETDTATYGLKIRDRFADLGVIREVERVLARVDTAGGRTVASWRDFNRAFFSALRLEKVLMFVLPGLIFVVVAFSIYHSLRRSVFERREEIALLGALGATRRGIRAIYVLEGAIIGFLGAVPGLAAGLAVSANVNRIFGWVEDLVNGVLGLVELVASPLLSDGGGGFSIFSPTFFYLSEVPSRVPLPEALGITVAGVLCAAVAALLASVKITRLDPASVLRHE